MADKDIKEQMTPLERKIAEALGATPEEAFVSAKLGLKPEQVLAQKKRQDKHIKIKCSLLAGSNGQSTVKVGLKNTRLCRSSEAWGKAEAPAYISRPPREKPW